MSATPVTVGQFQTAVNRLQQEIRTLQDGRRTDAAARVALEARLNRLITQLDVSETGEVT